jgi:hypothetical protein
MHSHAPLQSMAACMRAQSHHSAWSKQPCAMVTFWTCVLYRMQNAEPRVRYRATGGAGGAGDGAAAAGGSIRAAPTATAKLGGVGGVRAGSPTLFRKGSTF